MVSQQLAVDYTSKDYAGFRASLLEFSTRVFPTWKSRGESDFGVLMVENFAYLGDILSFYGDRIQQESYLSTATQRLSMLQIADLLGYTPSNGVPANGTVTLQTPSPGNPVLIKAGTQVATDYISEIDGPVVYETDIDVTVPGNGGSIAASVTEGTTYTQIKIGTSNGLPDQIFRLPNLPIIDDTVKVYVETETIPEEWVFFPYLIDADPEDRAFATFAQPDGSTWVRLGDGTNGVVPNTGLGVFASYRVGGGTKGNRLAGTITQIVTPIAGVLIMSDSNGVPVSSAMTGGADAETVEQIRRNAPLAFRTQSRAVTTRDFSDIALGVPGVSKAATVANHYTSVVTYIAGPNGASPNQRLKDTVTQTLTTAALSGVSVTVASPSIVKVNMGTVAGPITVTVKPRYHRALVQADIVKALQKMLAVANVSFGQRLSLSDVYATIAGVDGVMFANVTFFGRADAAQTGTADIQFRAWEIPAPGSINLNVSGGIG